MTTRRDASPNATPIDTCPYGFADLAGQCDRRTFKKLGDVGWLRLEDRLV